MVLRLRHLGHHSVKPGDFTDISISKVMQFLQGAGLMNAQAEGLHKTLEMVKVQWSLQYPP